MLRFLCLSIFIPLVSIGQELTPVNGFSPSVPAYYLLKNATILVSPNKTLLEGSILLKGDEIIEIGTKIKAPKDAVILDYTGKIIVPAFIETYSKIGIPEQKINSSTGRHLESNNKNAVYWNESIHPETDASELYEINTKENDELIKMGFGLAATHVQDGIARGNGALVSLGSTDPNKQLQRAAAVSFFSFDKGSSKQNYPSSQMGSIALLRQLFYDLQWYSHSNRRDENISLNALQKQINQPMIFLTEDKWEIMRIKKIADEFNLPIVLMGSGNEYQALAQIQNISYPLIVPINFPAAYDVKDPYLAKEIPLSELKHWEMAPSNPFLLHQNRISFSISSHGQKNAETFWKNLRLAISRGLSPADALQALTLEPAKTLKVDADFGSLEKGKKASFIIYDKNPFEEESKMLEAWILGEQKIYETINPLDIRGKYNVMLEGKKYPLEISGTLGKLVGKTQTNRQITDAKTGITKTDTVQLTTTIELINNNVTIQFNVDDANWKGSVNLHGKVNAKLGIIEGDGTLPNGKWITWSAIKNAKTSELAKENKKITVDTSAVRTWFPNMAFGFDSLPQQQTLVIRNATVWTNEVEGNLVNATVVVEKGKITYVGTEPFPKPAHAIEIDAKGKHLTSGIIDEHSHIAISKGVNEGGQSVTAEVNIGEVINPDDISIYRQLAGGVTSAQLLHGSANTIGGQSALIKLKWGRTPEEFLIPNAPKFIKCALGENVKQSNFGRGDRFPQTRMGVEQVYYDAFSRAKAYHEEWKPFKHLPHNQKQLANVPRKDLELEALWEILNGERFITCHSYVQSEINMLLHVADSMGFKINTFTHILEGYKVADKMAKHGAGGSTFSDWWAYKYEVNDAIPYNAKLMADQGVVVAINSDDAEMGRRLNQEAAKSVKYGGMPEIEAWKMVTLNPAKLLHLDDKMGSIKVGKDADLVIWTQNPLSIEAKVESTIIDGEIVFNIERDALLQQKNKEEKARIISKMLEESNKGEDKKPFVKKKSRFFHCNTLGEEGSDQNNEH